MTSRMRLLVFSTCAVATLWLPAMASAQLPQIERGADGRTYEVTRQRYKVPVTETQMRSQTQTVYRERYVTESQPSVRTTYTPVTEYQLEARWHGVLNPFAPAYVGYHYVPRTRWQRQDQQVTQTVTRRELVPETRTVNIPVQTRRMAVEERITRREIPAGSHRASVLNGNAVGGVAKVNDPPGKTVWQASGNRTIR